MCKLIDTRGMNINDIKSILIQNEEVVENQEFCELLGDHASLLTICFLANNGDERAKKFIETSTTELFDNFVPDNWKGKYIELNQKKLISLDSKEEIVEEDCDYEKLYENLLFEYSKYVGLTALAACGDEFSIKYIEEESKNDFDGLVPDEVKDLVLTSLRNCLDNIYKDDQDNENRE